MRVELIAHTPNPEKVVAAAAKLCYSPVSVTEIMGEMSDEEARRFIRHLSNLGHASPTEHASFTFAIEGVSRSLLAQITRHRIASYSVQSQRYVRLDDFKFVIPPQIEKDPVACALFKSEMERQGEAYLKLVDELERKHTANLVLQGVDEKEARRRAGKLANEDARFVLPNACETKMVVTMNARSLMNFFSLRCCNRAQWEIRSLAEEMYKLVYAVAPALFEKAGPGCVATGRCTEGSMSCGKSSEMCQKYVMIRKELD